MFSGSTRNPAFILAGSDKTGLSWQKYPVIVWEIDVFLKRCSGSHWHWESHYHRVTILASESKLFLRRSVQNVHGCQWNMLRPTFSCTYKRVVHVFSLFHGKGLGTSAGRPAYRLCTKYSKRHTHTHTKICPNKFVSYTKSVVSEVEAQELDTSHLFAERRDCPVLSLPWKPKGGVAQSWQCSSPVPFFGSRVWLEMRKLPRGCGSGVSNRLCAPATASRQRLQSRDEKPQKRVQSWLSAGFDPLQRLVLV